MELFKELVDHLVAVLLALVGFVDEEARQLHLDGGEKALFSMEDLMKVDKVGANDVALGGVEDGILLGSKREGTCLIWIWRNMTCSSILRMSLRFCG